MMQVKAKSTDIVTATVATTQGFGEGASGGGVFHFKCYDKDGNLKWEDSAKNLVVNAGLQDMNTKYFKGVTYTAAWYIGLVDNAGFSAYAAADTLASHAGWTESTAYSGGNRATATFGTATTADPSVISNSATPGAFSITSSVTIRGAFLCNVQSNASTSGLLFSVSDFTGGNRSVVNGDTLNVTYEFSLDAA
jgi:hypothetical protein